MSGVITSDCTDKELIDLPDQCKIELKKRYEDRVSEISKKKIRDLRVQLNTLKNLVDFPDQRNMSIKYQFFVNYRIDREGSNEVYSNIDNHKIDKDLTNEIDDILASKSVKSKVKRIHKLWMKLSGSIDQLSSTHSVPKSYIWDIVDIDHVLGILV